MGIYFGSQVKRLTKKLNKYNQNQYALHPNLAADHSQKKLKFSIPFFTFSKTPVKLRKTQQICSACTLIDLSLVTITFKTILIKTYHLINMLIKNTNIAFYECLLTMHDYRIQLSRSVERTL